MKKDDFLKKMKNFVGRNELLTIVLCQIDTY